MTIKTILIRIPEPGDEFERELDNLSDDDKDLIRAISDSVIAAHDYTGLTDVTIKLTEKAMAKGKVIA